MRKPDFKNKVRSIIGNNSRLENLDDFLSKNVMNDTDNNLKSFKENYEYKNSGIESKNDIQTDKNSKSKPKISREEFRLEYELAERLRIASFSTRKNKTQLIKEALESFLSSKGF